MKQEQASFTVALAMALAAMLALSACAVAAPLGTDGAGTADQIQPAAHGAGSSAGAFLTVSAQTGLPLDPFLVSVQGGGPQAAGVLAKQCTGYVSANPMVSLDFGDDFDLLRVFFYSDADTSLVVRTPDGAYLCGDDSTPLILDPTVDIAEPAPGRYEVWVGSKVSTDIIPGFLAFTTHDDVNASQFSLSRLVSRQAAPSTVPLRNRLVFAAERLHQAAAAVTTADALAAGGAATTKTFTATGELPAVELQTGDTLCGGLVNPIPDYAFDWSGDTPSLSLYAEADGDTTLLVRAPDGSLLCADDADGLNNLNPLLTIPNPAAGRYLVWVGRVDPVRPAEGVLTITEASDARPHPFIKP